MEEDRRFDPGHGGAGRRGRVSFLEDDGVIDQSRVTGPRETRGANVLTLARDIDGCEYQAIGPWLEPVRPKFTRNHAGGVVRLEENRRIPGGVGQARLLEKPATPAVQFDLDHGQPCAVREKSNKSAQAVRRVLGDT